MPDLPSWDASQQQVLSHFLSSDACNRHTMDVYQLAGYLHAIASGPGVAMWSEWMPLVFNDDIPAYGSEEQAQSIMDLMLSLYAHQAAQVADHRCVLPCEATYQEDKAARQDIEMWCRGFMQGYLFWDEHIEELLDAYGDQVDLAAGDAESVLDETLSVVSTVADAELALMQGCSQSEIPEVFSRLPDAVIAYGRLCKALYWKEKQHKGL